MIPLIVLRSKVIQVHDLLDVRLHGADHLELDIGRHERSRNLIQILRQYLLVDIEASLPLFSLNHDEQFLQSSFCCNETLHPELVCRLA